jgi:predicted ATP-grasp superfamily ATP-dependent carboligase
MRQYRRFWKGLHIADKRGIVDFRSKRDRDDGSILLLAITQKPGPKGGHTVAIGRYRPSSRRGSR